MFGFIFSFNKQFSGSISVKKSKFQLTIYKISTFIFIVNKHFFFFLSYLLTLFFFYFLFFSFLFLLACISQPLTPYYIYHKNFSTFLKLVNFHKNISVQQSKSLKTKLF